jgi:rhamnogalacturonan endolyase
VKRFFSALREQVEAIGEVGRAVLCAPSYLRRFAEQRAVGKGLPALPCRGQVLLLVLSALLAGSASLAAASAPGSPDPAEVPVRLTQTAEYFTLANGYVSAVIEKRSGRLESLKYNGVELLARGGRGSEGGYWSSVGRSRPGAAHSGVVRIDPGSNGGARAEVSCELHNGPNSLAASLDADYRYALGRGEQQLYVYAVLAHRPGFPPFSVGEARYCLKLNPEVFDYMTVDADRRRVMPTGADWDRGAPLNLKEARRMTTGVHKGEAEHKYDYSAVLAETPAYGWSSTKEALGLWLINPSMEYLGGGPTKAELTGHLDVNPGGLPTLLNMWVGSHYGGTTISVATNEDWAKVVGPFVLYLNRAPATNRNTSPAAVDLMHRALWQDALAHAKAEARLWPYAWVSDPLYPGSAQRSTVSGQLVLRESDVAVQFSNLWVGLSAPDYLPPRLGFGGFRRFGGTNSVFPPPTNSPPPNFGNFRGGLPVQVDWQRDAKFYQFWTHADAQGRFEIPQVRGGGYTLHAIADGVLGEFTLTNISVAAGKPLALGRLDWVPRSFGRTVWQIGVPDRTAREFRHGDHFWQWGLYFKYPAEFPQDVNYVVGKSDWRHDWNYVQPPRIRSTQVAVVSEEDEKDENAPPDMRRGAVQPSTWSISFVMPRASLGTATLRLAFCGTHAGCNVELLVNGRSVGETGTLPSTSAMQRDGIRAYWIEKDIAFDAALMKQGENKIQLLSHANSWSQGVMYDCVRLEMDEQKPFAAATNQ